MIHVKLFSEGSLSLLVNMSLYTWNFSADHSVYKGVNSRSKLGKNEITGLELLFQNRKIFLNYDILRPFFLITE